MAVLDDLLELCDGALKAADTLLVAQAASTATSAPRLRLPAITR